MSLLMSISNLHDCFIRSMSFPIVYVDATLCTCVCGYAVFVFLVHIVE